MQSIVQQLGNVKFPEFMAERVYMREFYKDKGLPQDLKRWQNTVDAMLDGISTDEPIYLMIDQAFVKAGFPHRRPGIHIDGYWNPGIFAHGGVCQGTTHSQHTEGRRDMVAMPTLGAMQHMKKKRVLF